MEIILVLGLIAFVIWLVTRGYRDSRKLEPAPVNQTRMRAAMRTLTSDDCWIPPAQEVTVGGYRIRDGMLYVGQGLATVAGHGVEPALINPSLFANISDPDRSGRGMTYWPSYSSISPECRAAYLEWLAAGRRDPLAYTGYVFLYFYGLERRAFADASRSNQAKQEIPTIIGEVEQLLHVYGGNNSFQRYATQFLDVLNVMAVDNGEVEPPMEHTGYELPLSLRVGIGRIVAAGKPLPADWALSWFLTHPETSLRTSVKRCSEEFRELFCARYTREFRDGLVLKPNRSTIKIGLTPASASFGGQVELTINLPDVAALTAPVSKLRQIGEGCVADLDAFSRWVGRNSDAPKTIAAVALLPPELATSHQSLEAQGLWDWIKRTIGESDRVVCNADDLLRNCASFGTGKLAKSEAVLLAQLLEKGGYGIEPDVRFGGAPLAPGGAVLIFKLPPDAVAIASPQYSAATVLLHLAVAISAADGSISDSEEQHLQEHMQRALTLSDAERLRLSAHMAWLMKSRPNLTGLKKRLEHLDVRQRSTMADFIIGVAGADGQISPDELRTLGKVYPLLGLAENDVYTRVHAMAAGAATFVEGSETVTVISAEPSTGYGIPARPGSKQTIKLDMSAIKAKLAQSAQVAAILDDIFTEEDATRVPPPVKTSASKGKVPAAHTSLLLRLAERSEWSRVEFEAMAAEYELMPEGAIDALNEAAFEHTGAPVLEGDDPIQVDTAAAKELVT